MNNIELKSIINAVYCGLKLNNFNILGKKDEPLFLEPMMGVVSGVDDYYNFLKTHIGEFHWSPLEVLRLKYKTEKINEENIRVISMVFPQNENTRLMQRKATVFPSDNWVVSRGEWEPLMKEFSGKLVSEMESLGYKAVSIDLQPEFQREVSEPLGIASRWSHRHSVYAAGLGTFSLSDGIITEKGMAVRLSTMVIEVKSEADQVIPTCTQDSRFGPYDWCLYYKDGSCGACIKRCPCEAISKNGHDKDLCSNYEDVCASMWPPHIERGDYKFGCGLCQAKVPCEYRRP